MAYFSSNRNLKKIRDELGQGLREFGAIDATIRWLDSASAENIDYLDLLVGARTNQDQEGVLLPDAVVERDSRAIAYILNANNLLTKEDISSAQIAKLRHNLACRADAKYLGIWRPGELEIYPIGLSADLPKPKSVKAADNNFLFPQISNGIFKCGSSSPQNEVHNLLFNLLKDVSNNLLSIEVFKKNPDDIIALIGRALFIRFLIDRNILNEETFPELYELGRPEACFETAQASAVTCKWLELNFNGNLLPLGDGNYEAYFEKLGRESPEAFTHVTNILYRAVGGQLSFDEYWNAVNYAHIPVGLLSRVYENFAHKLFEAGAKQESIYYTPYFIADLMVDQAFDAMPKNTRHLARVLDPSSGAGVFLITAFRRLVKERWIANGLSNRPDYKEIRSIMKTQITGFDINESALKLSALGLYLTAIELDPDPFPPEKLKFPNLSGVTLFCTRGEGEEYPKNLVLGSIGEGASKTHDGKYDLVVGNPPWTSWTGQGSDALNHKTENIVRQIAAERENVNDAALNYENPDKVTDLPFVWRAMQWAKPGASIAFALHGRLQFKREGPGKRARDAIFSALRVTGLMNGSEVDKKLVWPGMDAPFCLLFAINEVPKASDCLKFISLEHDAFIEKMGYTRIDYAKAQPVQYSFLEKHPTLLRTLAIGTALDAGVMSRIQSTLTIGTPSISRQFIKLGEYWDPRRGLYRGQGYRIAESSKQNPAQFLKEMKALNLTKRDANQFCVNEEQLELFSRETLHTPRSPEIYKTPLVLINEAPGQTRESVRASIGLGSRALAFNQSFFGFSAHGHQQAEEIARYLFVIANSDLYVYFMLLNSAKFADRRTVYGEDINELPFLPFEELTAGELKALEPLSEVTDEGWPTLDWEPLNNWVYSLYGLDAIDRQIIQDTLSTRLNYSAVRNFSITRPTITKVKEFQKMLETHLNNLPMIDGNKVSCRANFSASAPFINIDIFGSSEQIEIDTIDIEHTELFSHLAENQGASRILYRGEPGQLKIALLAQNRYWTKSRAHLLALDIARNYRDQFPADI